MRKIEENRKIKLPTCIFNNEGLKILDRVLMKKEPILIKGFYETCYERYVSNETFSFVSEMMKEGNRILTNEDKELIKKLSLIKKQDPEFFFDFIGNIYYLCNLIEKTKNRNLDRIIEVSIVLWCYLNIVETVARYLSEIVKEKIKIENKNKDYIDFIKDFENGNHPTIGKVVDTMVRLEILDKNKNTVMKRNKEIRDKMSHANLFYDEVSDKIYISGYGERNLEYFQTDMIQLKDFLVEFLYTLNDFNPDLESKIKGCFNKISKSFHHLARSHLKKDFYNIIFEWEK